MKELKITQGPVRRAQKVVLYGSEGIGKSTLAAQFLTRCSSTLREAPRISMSGASALTGHSET